LSRADAPLCPLPRDDGGPHFAEPWQAQAFALAVLLSERGAFTWAEWTRALASEIAQSDADDYWRNWVAALERMMQAKGIAPAPASAKGERAE
jgi:nitrile hydratase accessory protein